MSLASTARGSLPLRHLSSDEVHVPASKIRARELLNEPFEACRLTPVLHTTPSLRALRHPGRATKTVSVFVGTLTKAPAAPSFR